MSRLFTTEEILQNDASLLGFGTRYGVYQDGDVREPVDPASILLLLRDVDSDATTQINALFDQVRKQVPQNYHLRNLGFHFLRGRPRNLYGNANAIRIINEFNAAILKAQSLVTKYEDQREPSADPTWFIRYMNEFLGHDYIEEYGSQRETFRELLRWVTRFLSTRYRHWWQASKWDPTKPIQQLDGLDRMFRYGEDCNLQQHGNTIVRDAIYARCGRFYISTDPESPNDLPPRELRHRKEGVEIMFEALYRLTVDQAFMLWQYVFQAKFSLHSAIHFTCLPGASQ
ncbi:hypothetical protein F4823DRAFT_253902 [Ustulina deusta]|nr:hypothetical protein F4823DRAFT_253902 [Ustulina deusta]